MRLRLSLIALLLLIMIASCSKSHLQEELSFYAEQSQESGGSVALTATSFENEVLAEVNGYRASQGLNALKFSSEAYSDAEEHTMYMISEGKLSHDNFNTRAADISEKTQAVYVAENVAKNYDTPEKVLKAWLDSESHKNTLEGDLTHSSIAVREDSNGTLYYTQIFFKK